MEAIRSLGLYNTVAWTVWPIRAPEFVRNSGLDINPKGTVNVEHKVTNTIPNTENAHIIGVGMHAGCPLELERLVFQRLGNLRGR